MKQQQIQQRIADRLGIASLNPMQEAMLASDDSKIVLIAPTGSGKTLAFACRLMRSLRPPCGSVQAIVLAPSRELAVQIAGVIRPIAEGYKTVAFYGGHSMLDETASASVTPDIIIATPGRLLDHIRRSTVDISDIHTIVLDEYDKMLDLGFTDEMRRILSHAGTPTLRILTSATNLADLPNWVAMDGHITISGACSAEPRSRMDIVEIESPSRDKLQTLIDLLHSLPDGKAIIFVNHRESAERVHQALRKGRLPAGLYHGGLEQADRTTALDLLENGTTPILVATDLASRGLDIDGISAIIHYHIPPTRESWIHRNGRTARQQAEGTVFVIRSEADTMPDYIVTDRPYTPTGHSDSPIRSHWDTIYIQAGKKEKISKGDIAGFFMAQGGLYKTQVGRITVRDHNALVAVPAGMASTLLERTFSARLKGKKIRMSRLR